MKEWVESGSEPRKMKPIAIKERVNSTKNNWQLRQLNRGEDTIPASQHPEFKLAVSLKLSHQAVGNPSHEETSKRYSGLPRHQPSKLHSGPAALLPVKTGKGTAGIGRELVARSMMRAIAVFISSLRSLAERRRSEREA